jgi:hypothetical protein
MHTCATVRNNGIEGRVHLLILCSEITFTKYKRTRYGETKNVCDMHPARQENSASDCD